MGERDKAAMPAGRAIRLADLVGYGEGAVVSRALVQRREGSLTLFAFDEGQELSEHTAPFDALVQVLEGAAVVSIADHRVTVRAGETVLMPAHIPHSVHADQRFKMLLTMIRGKIEQPAHDGELDRRGRSGA